MMNYLQKKKQALLNYVSSGGGRLPSEYQEVEWIGSSGTQYIDSLYGSGEDYSLIKLEYTAEITSTSGWCVSGIGNSLTADCYIGGQLNNKRVAYGLNNVDTLTTIPYNKEKRTFIADYKNGVIALYDNDTEIGSETFTPPTNKLLEKYILLFGYNDVRAGKRVLHKAKYYSYKIYNDDVLERDFVPCYRKADDVIGMYDIVNDVFYTNSGSGTFTKGNDV